MRVRVRQGSRTERVEFPNGCSHAAACDIVASAFSIQSGSVQLSLNNRDIISSDLSDAGVCGGDLLYLMGPSSIAMPSSVAVQNVPPRQGTSPMGPSQARPSASARDLRAAAAEQRLFGQQHTPESNQGQGPTRSKQPVPCRITMGSTLVGMGFDKDSVSSQDCALIFISN
jgi:hypothetical protein